MNTHEYDKLPIEAVKKVAPAVVSVVISKNLPRARGAYPNPFYNPFMFGEMNGEKEKVKVGGGSGFIVHPDGLVLTNKHVVFDPEAEYTILTTDGQNLPGKVLSRDPINDIAVLKVPATVKLPTARLGNSAKLELGQTVIAIGNALGLFSNTVSKGIVSGLSRKISASLGDGGAIEHLQGVLQTDVAINQGNSGGPLVNLDGEVVGINTAIIYGAQNIGFSIPINWAKEDLEDIIKHGRIIKPFVGLQYIMLNKEIKERYGLPLDHGAIVTRDHNPHSQAVVPGSPADKAGVKENDIIVELNGHKLNEDHDFRDAIQKCKVGDEISLSVVRQNQTLTLKVILEERK